MQEIKAFLLNRWYQNMHLQESLSRACNRCQREILCVYLKQFLHTAREPKETTQTIEKKKNNTKRITFS